MNPSTSIRYAMYRFLALIIRALPLKGAYWLGLRICDLTYFFRPRERHAVETNLRIILEYQGIIPSEHILKGCARKTFQQFGKYLADFIRFRRLALKEIRRSVSISGMEYLEALHKSERGAILVTAHYGNWELGGAFIASMGLPFNAVVRPVASPAMERIYTFFREQRGMKIIHLDHVATGIIRALKRGEMVALVGDRDFTGTGLRRSFFGRETSLPHGAAWFAHRLKVPLVYGAVSRAPDDSYILRIHKPIDPGEVESEEEIQQKVEAMMQETIMRDPCQWFIFDPFWPNA
ncbi:MAG: lysophospholipid acyltransferase family protein [Verrucomicrobiota bacterium]|jgi:KDO2-lipid IV(A) lauroyltransferase|nr:lysophospholipid acyltransferase family protein [Verrucomicrobiota bacterium]